MSNPRRTPMTRPESVLPLKTTLVILRKGATFHSPTSPSTPESSSFIPPPLPCRSQSNLDDVIDAHRRRVALTLGDIDKTLSASSTSSSPKANKAFRDNSFPLPRGLLSPTLIGKDMDIERRVLRPRPRRSNHHHESDSGLGSSIRSTKQKSAANADTSSIQTGVKGSAVTRSAASSTAKNLPGLSARATNRIFEHTLKPLLADSSFKELHPVLLESPKKIQSKQIVCLRDVEKTLLLTAQSATKAAKLYLDFCLSTIRCIQNTVVFLSENEQRRPSDVPYSSGYFIDLVDQIHQYAQQLAEQKKSDNMDFDIKDEIKLHGGIAVNGRPAELVRIRNGKAISMATGEPVELEEEPTSPIRFKRSASQQLADDDEIIRSMARRKKNAPPEEYAPKMCREPGCGKEFKRPCDLTKHEKTHSRPWKCPVPTCKYHDYGWPTEKEMDRHHNDKHSSAPPMFECLYKPCPYKSKRESNCKQHMEKAHGWTYVRTKANGGKKISNPSGSVTHNSPPIPSMPTPVSDNGHFGLATPPQDFARMYQSIEFPAYIPNDQFVAMDLPQELQLDYSPSAVSDHATPSTDSAMGISPHESPYQDMNSDFTVFDDIYNAHAQIPQVYNPYSTKDAEQFLAFTQAITGAELCKTRPVPVPYSPAGQGNTMLFTPSSFADNEETFDEFQAANMGVDFCLFPGTESKQNSPPPLFGEIPSVVAGYSQPNSQELFPPNWAMGQFQGYSQN